MKLNLLLLSFMLAEIICLFDEEIIMEKPLEGKSGLFFRRKDQNHFYISNSVTNYLFNIRDGTKEIFGGIIPSSSTTNEPFHLLVNDEESYFIDAFSKNKFIKIYDLKNDIYKEYTGLEINEEYERKFFQVPYGNQFGIAILDKKIIFI